VLPKQLVGLAKRAQRQISPVLDRCQECSGCAFAFAIPENILVRARSSLLLATIEIPKGIALVAETFRCLAKGLLQGAVVGDQFHAHGAIGTVELVTKYRVRFRPPEVGQYVEIGPPFVAEIVPVVVIQAVSPVVEQRADGSRAAQRLAPGPRDSPPFELRFRLGLVLPI